MMKRLPLVLTFTAGYILGARAGRGRYEQIANSARKVAGNPTVQAASSKATDAVKETATAAASTVQEKVSERRGSISPTGTTTGGLN